MNFMSSTEVGTVLIKYADGIKTLVVCSQSTPKYIAEKLRAADVTSDGLYDSTRQIDGLLQCGLDLCQVMLRPDDRITVDEIVELPYPYTLGENESEADVQKLYPDYKNTVEYPDYY